MSMSGTTDELAPTDHVHALADIGAISKAIADRLDDHGFETIADLQTADSEELEDVPYVGPQRADEILWAVADNTPERDPVADALDVELGEKVELVTDGQSSWSTPFCVVDVAEPVTWTAPLGNDFETRTLTVRKHPQSGKQYDLLVAGDEVWMAGEYDGRPYRRLWRLDQVNPVGQVSQARYLELVGQQQEQQDARPDGDDSWRQYHQGETA